MSAAQLALPMMGYATEKWERVYMLCLIPTASASEDEDVIARIDGILRTMDRSADVNTALRVVTSYARGGMPIDAAFSILRELSEARALD